MNQDCRSLQKDFSAYLDGELSPAGSQLLEEHLKACPHCASELAGWETAAEALRGIGAVSEAPDQWRRIRARLQQSRRRVGVSSSASLWLRWAAAAACLLLILSLVQFWPFSGSRHTGVDPYLGLYLLVANASDVLSSQISAEDLPRHDLEFPVYTPPAVESWTRQGIYFHELHGQPVIQIFYSNTGGATYCAFQQSRKHALDFGSRETRQDLIRNQICTKFASRHFNLISWTAGETLFTLVSSTPGVDLNSVASAWIARIQRPH